MPSTVNDRELRGSDFRVGISFQAVKDLIDPNPVFVPVRRTSGKTNKVIGYVEDPSVNGRMQAQEQIEDTFDLSCEIESVMSKQAVDLLIQALHADTIPVEVSGTTIEATETGFATTGGGFASLQPGDGVWVSGFTDATINGFYIVASGDANAIVTTVAPADEEAPGAAVTLQTRRAFNADSPSYSAIQTRGTDLSQPGEINYHTLYNAVPNTLSFTIGETGIVTASVAFVAEMEVEGTDPITGQTYAPARTDRAVTTKKGAQSTIRAFYVNNLPAGGAVKSMSMEINNNYQKDPAAGGDAFYARGNFQASGSLAVRSKISNPFTWRDYSWNATRVAVGVRMSHGNGEESFILVRRAVVNDVTMPDGNNVIANAEANYTAEEDVSAGVTVAVYKNWA